MGVIDMLDAQGSALLELCLVLPLLFALIWGTLALALYAIESQILNFSAFVAARTALLDSQAEVGEKAAANFLTTACLELGWRSPTLRKLSGLTLSVSKVRNRVEVEIARERGRAMKLLGWLFSEGQRHQGALGLGSSFQTQRIQYAVGR